MKMVVEETEKHYKEERVTKRTGLGERHFIRKYYLILIKMTMDGVTLS